MRVPRWLSAALRIASSCFLSPENERATKVAPSSIGQRAGVDRRQVVDDAVLQLRADVGGRRELALGQAVAAVVLDDVDERQVAPHQVDELADADGAGVAVAADADAQQRAVGQQRAGRDRRHAAVHGVEAVRRCRGSRPGVLLEQPMPDSLMTCFGLDAHLVERVDDALGDGVVPAAGAQRRLAAAIGGELEADAVGLLAAARVTASMICDRLSYSPPTRRPRLRASSDAATGLRAPSCARMSVGDRPRVDRQAVVVQHLAQLGDLRSARELLPAAGRASARRGSARRRRRDRGRR